VNGRPDDHSTATGAVAGSGPNTLADVSLDERWAPLVRSPGRQAPQPAKIGLRTLVSALCLIVLALILWALG